MTQYAKALILAHKKGYRITKDGNAINPKQKKIGNIFLQKGYKTFSFRLNESVVPVFYHRLQAYQKFGDKIFEDGIQVRHLNNDSLDNSWDNIDIGNQSQNMMDKPKEVRQRCAEHASSFMQKHDHEAIKEFYEQGNTYADVMEEFDISSKGTVSYIINK